MGKRISLIADSGIHYFSTTLKLDQKDRFSLWFHEWYDVSGDGSWVLDLAQEVYSEGDIFFYKKKDLMDNGYADLYQGDSIGDSINIHELEDFDGQKLKPIKINEEMQEKGEVFKLSFSDKKNKLQSFENKWLPLPYFAQLGETKLDFGPLNWSRFMLIPQESETKETIEYKVVLAFDTRTSQETTQFMEMPFFQDTFSSSMNLKVCDDEFSLMDYCTPSQEWAYVEKYLLRLVYGDISSPGRIKGNHKLLYIASYFLLIDYIAQLELFPVVTLYRGTNVPVKEVDLVIDIGNSRTTALLIEDSSTFNQVSQLELMDYTTLIDPVTNNLKTYQEPFDMRLVFRRVSFGDFGFRDSQQFVYPSYVRLGKEAHHLLLKASESNMKHQYQSTLSSPKRYLWDSQKSEEEWRFLVLKDEHDEHILHIPGVSNQLSNDGSLTKTSTGGKTFYFSRKSLMSLAFLEILTQAQRQINSAKYREDRGEEGKPRRIRRIIVTCPTAMSKVEREALVKCAEDGALLLQHFMGLQSQIEVIPSPPSFRDQDGKWYFDEATCAQLVYIYGEIGYKYSGACSHFFNLYGKNKGEGERSEITVGLLDIGAGTSDLIINKYSYETSSTNTVLPDPLFYDSFYYAGDDMMSEMVKNIIFFSPKSSLREISKELSQMEYRQKLRDFFGPNYAGQTLNQRNLRKDFTVQYIVPLMNHFLMLLSNESSDRRISYDDVFDEMSRPSKHVLYGFEQFWGAKVEDLSWSFVYDEVANVVSNAFEPLLKKIATIMYSFECDIVLLSGRPSSLSPIRELFLKYYSVAPNRLILLNDYYVGHWYPFSQNTGKIKDPKTVVAVGALIGYYASEAGNLNGFAIDSSLLDSKLESVVNYIDTNTQSEKVEDQFIISPDKLHGELDVNAVPLFLQVRQLPIETYPSRELYKIDFDHRYINMQIRNQLQRDGVSSSDLHIRSLQEGKVQELRKKRPFRISIEREQENKESLNISSVIDRNGQEINPKLFMINIQSLGSKNNYWLDSGIFDIQ